MQVAVYKAGISVFDRHGQCGMAWSISDINRTKNTKKSSRQDVLRLVVTVVQSCPGVGTSSSRAIVPRALSKTRHCISSSRSLPDLDDDLEIERIRRALQEWKEKYCVCIIPKSVSGEDARFLSKAMKTLRKHKHVLDDVCIQDLEDAGMIWTRPNTVESKWFANFHVALEYLEEQRAQGASCDAFLHPDQETFPFHHETRSDVVEASRWLCRQRELYRKQKLTLMQVHLIKRVLGVRLTRQYMPTRRNKHPILREKDKDFLHAPRRIEDSSS